MNRLPIALLAIALVGAGCQQDQKKNERRRAQTPAATQAAEPRSTDTTVQTPGPTQIQPKSASEGNTKAAPPTPAAPAAATRPAPAVAAPAAKADTRTPATMPAGKRAAVAQIKPSKAAASLPKNNNVTGTATFSSAPDNKVLVVVQVSGLEPNGRHGIHIHEKGDLSAPDLMSTGDHFNPDKHQHGAPGGQTHAGDFGNLHADAQGNAKLELVVSNLSVGTGKPNDVINRAIIIHANPDDLTSQPSGNSGARIAGGLISPK